MQTHETYIASVANLAIARLADQSAFKGMKLAYGMGENGAYGVTYFKRWKAGDEPTAFVEIGARHQHSWQQIVTTTLHELGHVLAGWEAGHGKEWKQACETLGLRFAKAVGMHPFSAIEPALRWQIIGLERPDDGTPICPLINRFGKPVTVPKPCTGGEGTRGGKSRGPGSGSRLRLFECECVPPVKARVAREEFKATCDCCSGPFRLIAKREG